MRNNQGRDVQGPTDMPAMPDCKEDQGDHLTHHPVVQELQPLQNNYSHQDTTYSYTVNLHILYLWINSNAFVSRICLFGFLKLSWVEYSIPELSVNPPAEGTVNSMDQKTLNLLSKWCSRLSKKQGFQTHRYCIFENLPYQRQLSSAHHWRDSVTRWVILLLVLKIKSVGTYFLYMRLWFLNFLHLNKILFKFLLAKTLSSSFSIIRQQKNLKTISAYTESTDLIFKTFKQIIYHVTQSL